MTDATITRLVIAPRHEKARRYEIKRLKKIFVSYMTHIGPKDVLLQKN
jgi:hypothetical protein